MQDTILQVRSNGSGHKPKPVIGIVSGTIIGPSGPYLEMERTYVNTTYVDAILRNGGLPILIPSSTLLKDGTDALEVCDGLLFPGGEDADPALYGEDPLPVIGAFRRDLDDAALIAGRWAIEQGRPLLGICKGLQILNIMKGGSLYQDISLQEGSYVQHVQKYSRSILSHNVQIVEGSRLAAILGTGTHRTNSMHHQAVKRLGDGLRIAARAADGVVEAIESDDGLIVAVQWHPEDLIDTAPEMNKLFADLVRRSIR